ncbi:MAG: primosomal protein N' [Candidatus Pacebacteria bacterium]|nr:primosomal protein N' [Candidatus Paceibacterota bacterium]
MSLNLVKIVPITKGAAKELFYFSQKDIKKGSIVSAEIRKKETPCLVLSSESIKDAKSRIKNYSYPLKKISSVKADGFFTEEFIEAAKDTADYFLSAAGNVVKELCPQAILENPPAVKDAFLQESLLKKRLRSKELPGLLSLQSPLPNRIIFYKNLIRSEFARGNSIFLCLPTSAEAMRLFKEIEKGIEQFSFIFTAKTLKRDLKKNWAKVMEESHPVFITATPLFLSVARKDIKTFIIENEGSFAYKKPRRPFLNFKKAAENLARRNEAKIIFADEIPSAEIHYKIFAGKITAAAPVQEKITSTAEQTLVDAKKQKTVLSEKIIKMVEEASTNNQKTILFINRRGFGLQTICEDCGKIMVCPRCETPLTLHKTSGNEFLCHKCFNKTPVFERCPDCGSWRMKTLGWGIQAAEEELKEKFHNLKILRLDADSAKTKKQGREIMKKYEDSPSAVLIATEMLFSFWGEETDNIGIVSVDSMLSLPDFRINERIFRLLFLLKTRARKTFIIQTRMPENPIFENVIKGDASGFYRFELDSRKNFGYPPFKTLIKIILEGRDKNTAQKEITSLEKKLEDYNPTSFSAFTPKIKNFYRFFTLLKIEPGKWPDQEQKLFEILSSLPREWKIDVDPESLL